MKNKMERDMESLDMSRFACTTMIVGKKATKDGSVIIAHSDDDVVDERVIYVPPRRNNLADPREKLRAVYYDSASLGPDGYHYNSTDIRRYIGDSRGPGYQTQDEGYSESKPIGFIPQVEETYGYFDSNYGIINEHNLMIGECTCGAKFQPKPDKDKRLFYSAELSRVALERTKSAREAILLISQLIEDYGYYGTGETLLIGDCDEGWVMEMSAYDDDSSSGVWVARRVDDEEFFVAANEFRIRDIKRGEEYETHGVSSLPGDEVWYSRNLFDVAMEKNWEVLNNIIDWLPSVSWGEYSHPYYSLRRVWRAFSKAAPSSNLSPEVEGEGYTRDYPFSLKPDNKLSVLDVINIYRDHYEETEFDLTKGFGAGAWGNPVRYENNPDQGDSFNLNTYHPKGAWERPLSIYRCGMIWINQAKKVNGKPEGFSWIGLDRPASTCLIPFYSKMGSLPKKIETMNLLDFQYNGNSSWWAFNFVSNLLNRNYTMMMKDLKVNQNRFEKEAHSTIAQFFKNGDFSNAEKFCNENFNNVIDSWWSMATEMIIKYNNGSLTKGPKDIMEKIDYPKEWLEKAGYYEGPIKY